MARPVGTCFKRADITILGVMSESAVPMFICEIAEKAGTTKNTVWRFFANEFGAQCVDGFYPSKELLIEEGRTEGRAPRLWSLTPKGQEVAKALKGFL